MIGQLPDKNEWMIKRMDQLIINEWMYDRVN